MAPYITSSASVKSIIKEAKSDYYASEIEQCGSDNKRLYRLLNGLMQRRKSPCLPAIDNIRDLATRFSNFCSKIDTIRVAYVLSLQSLALRTQSTITGATYSFYNSLALRTQSTLTGATYSVYTHWRYVLSLQSLALRTQSTITGATYSFYNSLALRTQSTITGATYSVYTHWRYVLSLHSLALRAQSTTHLHHRPTSNTMRVTTSLTSGCDNIRHPQPAQQIANNIARARTLNNMAAERRQLYFNALPDPNRQLINRI